MVFLKDESQRQLVCPKCRRPGNLWQGVYVHEDDFGGTRDDDEAWHDIEIIRSSDSGLDVTYSTKKPDSLRDYIDVDFQDWEYVDDFGCSECGWMGGQDELRRWAPTRLGWDGFALRVPLPGQLELETT